MTTTQQPRDSQSPYQQAGVDVEVGNALVDTIRPLAQQTERPGALGSIGGFGGLFDLRAAGYTDPLLVAATDGVGTKLRIAVATKQLHTIGIDLVAMCVNDLLCNGAEPLFFLDYYATAHLEPTDAKAILDGIAKGCRQANVALVGGETAEMPGMYRPGDFDLAGFAVGAVNRDAVLPVPLTLGDRLLAIASAGFHANGYSLVREVVRKARLSWDDAAPFASGHTIGPALLTPTRIYTTPVLPLLSKRAVNALVHVTGGGLADNIARVLGADQAAEIDLGAWQLPACFEWLAAVGDLTVEQLLAVFNCGIGMVLICSAAQLPTTKRILAEHGEVPFEIGRIVARTNEAVTFVGEPQAS